MDKAKEIEKQYDKIYRYCYFKLHKREAAEDITQETFLRFLENETYQNEGKALQYFYTVARNLCIDEYRKNARDKENIIADKNMDRNQKEMEVRSGAGFSEEQLVNSIALRKTMEELEEQERELLLLRYVNEVPVSVLCSLYRISRFALYRRLKKILKDLREKLK